MNRIPNLKPTNMQVLDRCVMICPVCQSTKVWPTAVVCFPPGTAAGMLTVDADGIHLDRTENSANDGVSIGLGFGCDNGHDFVYRFYLCQGLTFFNYKIIKQTGPTLKPIWVAPSS